eukprot:CAMPEP_0181244432 /NCGR_PEP_ID=MMETSP1096-20121128/42858_1 /TAXON_ID=156174 ORGANISM="Chrysochromulina ericina, Strain CCMP281" /NCGR_SAMPLE_ID=MMETSP1096 /ASSEMBLY_ACC=CAM_ASM_000453 /LENGTH=65 /DNA_ID=CAMNT_0023340983 /DNA_START=339 /DNA_END=536 /DNA_ORIENTATION=-
MTLMKLSPPSSSRTSDATARPSSRAFDSLRHASASATVSPLMLCLNVSRLICKQLFCSLNSTLQA